MRSSAKRIAKKIYLYETIKRLYRNYQNIGRVIRRTDVKIIHQSLDHKKIKKLHLGCGDYIIDGWLNSDLFPKTKNILRVDATKKFPFDDETFDYIFTEHMIGGLTFAQGQHMLRECIRVLKSNGILRISTPHLRFLISLYRSNKSELQEKYIRWATDVYLDNAPYYYDTFVINNFVQNYGIKFIYDEKVLRYSLEKAGFKNIELCNLNESDHKALRNLENEERMPEGLLKMETFTMEGVKM